MTAIFTYGSIRNNLIASGKRQLATSTTALMKQLDVLGERAGEDVQLLSLDYALRKAVAEHDPGTAMSALRNHGDRIGAGRMMLVALNGKITADTSGGLKPGAAFPFPNLIRKAVTENQATAVAVLDNRVYWTVAVPVQAPVPIAFIVACIPVDDALLDRLVQLSAVPQSLAVATQVGGAWRVVAHTSGYSPRQIAWPRVLTESDPVLVSDESDNHVDMFARLATAQASAPVLALFDYPLDRTLDTYRAALKPMLVLLIALMVALAATVLVARDMSRPLELLAAAARRIAKGDYAPIPQFPRQDEVSELAVALNGMTEAVHLRETALRNAVVSLDSARSDAVTANEAKSQFLSNMSHELRTPLNAIVGFSEMIKGQMLGPISSRYAEYARHIYEAGVHLSAQFEQMLHLAQAESGRLTLVKKCFAAGPLVHRSVKRVAGAAEQAGVRIEVEGDFDSWPEMEGDEAKLQTGIANLIDNAIKFSPPGAVVIIRGARARSVVKGEIGERGGGRRRGDLARDTGGFARR